MTSRALGLALAWAALCASASGAMVDAWIEALATTEIRYDQTLIPERATVGDGLRATLAAVRKHHPGLGPLKVLGEPASVLAKPFHGTRVAQDAIAGDIVFELVNFGGVRVEVTNDRLIVVETRRSGPLRNPVTKWQDEIRIWTAFETGSVDAATLDLAARTLRRARVVSTGNFGTTHLAALTIIRRSADAVPRFEAILRQGTPEGRLYAMIGLSVAGEALPGSREAALANKVKIAYADILEEEVASTFFRRVVQTGEFAQRVEDTLGNPVSPVRRHHAAMLQSSLSAAARGSQPPVTQGRILFEEINQGFGLVGEARAADR